MGEGTFVQMDGDATNSAGARYALAGDRLTARGSAVRSGIESAEGPAPWGDDKFGKAFLEKYGNPQDGDETLTFMTDGGDQVSTVGNAVQWAAVDGIDADSQAKQAIHSLETDKPKVAGSRSGSIMTATRTRSERTGSSGNGTGSGSGGSRTTGAVDARYATAEATGGEGTDSRQPDRRLSLASVATGGMTMLHAVDEPTPHEGDRRMAHEVFRSGVGWVTDGVLPEGSERPGDGSDQVEFRRATAAEFTPVDGASARAGELHAVYRQDGAPTDGAAPMHPAGSPQPGSGWSAGHGYPEFRAVDQTGGVVGQAQDVVSTDQHGGVQGMEHAEFRVDGAGQPVDGAERYVQEVYRQDGGWTPTAAVADPQGMVRAEGTVLPGAEQV
ncbi:hypothetical protein Athai_07780 [Actinocatenispora thailandica]|uniref:Uncharacterized protein n=1 Tax=Actinocatenispora thailandica TaxID=227318 RepID=A0A7R7DKN8_9ACTN|nr:hypothetical protein [Actinocatenispora thailandica]BCJ33275.1 hypothetical protein Athai_07780 [Actinocatenispora thailandica]